MKEKKYSNNDLQNLVTHLPGYVCIKDVDGVYIACNDQQAQLLGFNSGQEIIGKTDADFPLLKAKAKAIRTVENKVMKQRCAITAEASLKVGNKAVKVLCQTSPFINEQRDVCGVICTASDITERKEYEEQTWLLEDIIGKMPGHVWWKDRNCRFLGCNNQQAKVAGLHSRYEIKGKRAYDIINKDQPEEERIKQAQKIDNIDKKIMESGVGIVIEEPLILPDGKEAIYLSNKQPLYDKDGNVVGLIGIALDITAQKEAEHLKVEIERHEALEAKNQLFKDFTTELLSLVNKFQVLNDRGESELSNFDSDIKLTKRETEILYFLSRGKKPKEIATKLGVSPKTVQNFIDGHLFPKFETHSIGDLIDKAHMLGLIPFTLST